MRRPLTWRHLTELPQSLPAARVGRLWRVREGFSACARQSRPGRAPPRPIARRAPPPPGRPPRASPGRSPPTRTRRPGRSGSPAGFPGSRPAPGTPAARLTVAATVVTLPDVIVTAAVTFPGVAIAIDVFAWCPLPSSDAAAKTLFRIRHPHHAISIQPAGSPVSFRRSGGGTEPPFDGSRRAGSCGGIGGRPVAPVRARAASVPITTKESPCIPFRTAPCWPRPPR